MYWDLFLALFVCGTRQLSCINPIIPFYIASQTRYRSVLPPVEGQRLRAEGRSQIYVENEVVPADSGLRSITYFKVHA